MANNYYDMTGVLVLDRVTPVIKALFGAFELDENYPGNGQAYIANISESSNCSWESVLENLQKLVEELGLSLPKDAEDNVETHLHVLATHFSANKDEALSNLIEFTDFDDDADLDSLFAIARALNDGHGLKACKTETAWHCNKPRLFEFGGCGDFTGMHVAVGGSSNQVVQLGEEPEAALTANDATKAAEILIEKVGSILAGVYDENTRATIRSKMGDLLSEPKAKYFAVTGRIPGDDEDTLLVFQVATREEALAAFDEAMWENEHDPEYSRESVRKEHGQTVFWNSVVVSDSPITDVA